MAKYRAKQESIMRPESSGAKGILAGTDWLTVLLCLCASAYGLLLVHSVTRDAALQAGSLRFDLFSSKVIAMAGGIAIGLLAALAMSFVDYELLLRFWYIIAAGCLLLMLLLLVPGVGTAVNPERGDAIRWIKIPGTSDTTFQPSELLKLGFIISFTWHLHRERERINKLKTIALLGLHIMVPFGLVIITGDLGSALVFLFVSAGMLFIAGMKLRWFAALLALGSAALPLAWVRFMSEFQKNRVYAVYLRDWLSEEDYNRVIYQQQQGVNAIGSGQLFGKGLFNGTVDVPVHETDMIFSAAGEQLGFLGCMLVLLLLAAVVIRLITVSRHTRNLRARLLCTGVALMISAQAIVNIGVCLKLLPVTGITLPFFSGGGSANLSLYLTIGLAFTVFRHQNEHEDTQSYFDYLYS